MTLSFPWLWLLLLLPMVGSLWIGPWLSVVVARRAVMVTTALTFLSALGLAYEFFQRGAPSLQDPYDLALWIKGKAFLQVDEFSVVLLLFGTLTFVVVALVAPRTEKRVRSFGRMLAAESMTLGSFCCQEPSLLALFWVASIALVYSELSSLGEEARAARVLFGRYMGLSALCFTTGAALFVTTESDTAHTVAASLFVVAFLIRKGIVPFHSWVPEFFSKAPLGVAILFNVPQLGSYAAVRLVVPLELGGLLGVIGVASLLTAIYGAGIALVQKEARRAYGFLFMSQSALVLVGIESLSMVGLAGSVALWLSGGLALTGFGLTLWVLEARRGPVSLHSFLGWYERMPALATSFLILGLASVGFPGTFGFIGGELLVDGAIEAFLYIGFAVVAASALNGINVLRMYFVIFCGAKTQGASSLQKLRPREYISFAVLALLLVLGGIFPKPFVASLGRAAEQLLRVGHEQLHPTHKT